ncbi:MAG: TRAP transporter small permease subunit [Alphaproteobacteria bacterium]|jgi:C4-dicarboxylate transporter DctQ subunit|nr:TRAP transporter small permease subunit [Alphaproteobacteria bacterium]
MIISFDLVLSRIERFIMLSSYLTLILIVSLETLRRMITGDQFGWGPDVSMYAFVWLAWFSMSANLRSGNQLAFMTFRSRMSDKTRRYFEILDCFIWLVIGAVVITTSYNVVLNDLRLGRNVFGTDIPMALASAAVPLGWSFSMMRILQILVALLRGENPHPPLATENISGQR